MKHEIEPEKMIDTSRPGESTEAQQRLFKSLQLEPPKNLPIATVNITSLGYTAKSQAPEAKDLPTTRLQQKPNNVEQLQQSPVGMSL